MIHKVKTNKKYPFKQMQPGERFKLKDDDIRSAQKMASYYRTQCKRPKQQYPTSPMGTANDMALLTTRTS